MTTLVVTLRLLEPEDADVIAGAVGDCDDLHDLTTGHEVPWSRESAHAYVRRAVAAAEQRSAFVFMVVTSRSRSPVGVVELNEVNWIHRRAKVGITIWSPSDRGSGAGTSALREVVAIAFGRLNLARLFATIFVSNTRSRALFTGMGFTEEGLLRSHAFLGGEPTDMVVVGLVRAEWSKR
jgi:RimJ/RimL family protein N-acetyltransferase